MLSAGFFIVVLGVVRVDAVVLSVVAPFRSHKNFFPLFLSLFEKENKFNTKKVRSEKMKPWKRQLLKKMLTINWPHLLSLLWGTTAVKLLTAVVYLLL